MTLVLLYYLGWSYLRQTEFEMKSLFFFLLLVYSCASLLDIVETWPDPIEYLFQSVDITQTLTFRDHLHPSSSEFGWRDIEISTSGAVTGKISLFFGHLWIAIICSLLKKEQPKRWRFCDGSLKEGGSNGGHKFSPDIFQKYSCKQRIATFLLFCNT